MSVPVLTFFNNKGGVGKTSLAYHLAWMMAEQGERVLACDLDPQANLTASFMDEDDLESVWEGTSANGTVYRCIKPLTEVGDLTTPHVRRLRDGLYLVPGDLALASFEDNLSREWPDAMGAKEPYRPLRILTAFWEVMQRGAEEKEATIIVADVGPNLGAINRSALIATDYVIAPLGADLFSLRGLRNLGPALKEWREGWSIRRKGWQQPAFRLPNGAMNPIGYIVQQYGVRLERPVKAFDKWINRMPTAYAKHVLGQETGSFPATPDIDAHRLATIRHYRSLVPMAQEARKPIFDLRPADGAIGSHATAARQAYKDFARLAQLIREKIGLAD